MQIAREWVKVDDTVLKELKRLVGKMPMPASGLTDKNKRFLRQFDDPAALQRLFNLPKRLWAEVKWDQKASFRTLAKAQAALAVALLSYIPLRLQNLTVLTFGTHLFMSDAVRATSTLELSAGEVKNGTELAFDIPRHVAKMLIEYRDRIASKIIGAVELANAWCPVAISYSTAPNEKRSARASASNPRACSGAR